jgi:hypothetical protein
MKHEIELPYSKLWTTEEPRIEVKNGQLAIKYNYAPGSGDIHQVEIRFNTVLAYTYSDESCYSGSLDFIADGVVQFDLEDSPWLVEKKKARDQFFRPGTVVFEKFGQQFDFYHFGVWFAEEGIFEVIAQMCEVEVVG